jgi:hypothetical protein
VFGPILYVDTAPLTGRGDPGEHLARLQHAYVLHAAALDQPRTGIEQSTAQGLPQLAQQFGRNIAHRWGSLVGDSAQWYQRTRQQRAFNV